MSFPSNTRRARLVALVAGLGATSAACLQDPGVVYGEIGQSKFRYECDGSAAVGACTTTAAEFPKALAQGGLFRLTIDSSSPVASLRPISDEVVGSAGGGMWVCGTEGTAGLVAFNRKGEVIDYVHLPVETPTRLAIEGRGVPVRQVSVAEGTEVVVAVAPRGKSGLPLAGALTYAWSTGPEGVATVTSSRSSAFVRVAGQKRGTTRLRVEGAGLTTDIEVRVP